ncbi:MFS transporter [Streptomyces odontomachi]|uniref:MFS transporter n=1 Tax=Streptomyces odontomachi TaxID=2944940 RepID=UPI00210CF5A7|nr:MFS transporter [Streptomyces sp. ODS25]
MSTGTLTVRSSRDVIDYVNSHPTGTRRTRILALIALGGVFVDAYDLTSLGLGIGTLTESWQLTSNQVGLLTSIMAVGALLGALVGGPLVDRLGRYKLFILDLVLFVVAALGAGLAPNYEVLLFCRFLLGFGVGVDMPASFSFVAEFTDRSRKGGWVNMWQFMWYVAVVGAAVLTLPFYFLGAGDELWRWVVGFGAVPALVVLLLRLRYTEESPMWAAHNLGLREAAKILESSYGISVEVAESGEEERPESQEKRSGTERLRMLFNKRYRARTFLASMVSGTQAAQYFAVGFYIPTIAAMAFGSGLLETIIATILINCFGLVGGWLQARITGRLSMRTLATIGFVIVIVCAVTLGFVGTAAGGVVTAVLVGFFVFGQAFGPGAQGKTLAALSYPTTLRGTGTGWAESMSRVGSILGFYIFPVLLAAYGLNTTMRWLTLVPVAGLLAVLAIRWNPMTAEVEDDDAPMAPAAERTSVN